MTNKISKQITTPSFEYFKNNNATVTELRVGIFAPISQITASSITHKEFVTAGRVRKIQTAWGEVKVKGNILTQVHRNIIDAIFATATYSEKTKAGNVALFFSGYEIQKFLGLKSSTNNTWLKKKLDEIKTTNVEFKDKEGNEFDFNITDSGGYSAKKDSFVIVFTEGYMNFFQSQVTVNYKEELKRLMAVEDPAIQAMIRFFFTHANNVKISFEPLLEAIGYPCNATTLKKARKKMRDHIEDFKNFGIEVNPKTLMLSYSKLDSITHNVPNNKKKIGK